MAADKDIRYTVTAEDRFTTVFNRLKRELADSGQQLTLISGLAARATGALGLVGAGAGVALFSSAFRQLANDLDALNDASDALGDSVGNLSALEDVARRNGESLELVVGAVNKLNKSLGEAKPDSAMAQAIKSIGLSAEELRTLDPTEALRRIAVALQGYENDGNKARIMQELFGKSSRQVASFLKDLAEAGELNATVTASQAAAAERFNKELAALSTNAGNFGRALVSDLLPPLNDALVRMRVATDVFGGAGSAIAAFLGTQVNFNEAGAGVAYYTSEIAKLEKKKGELLADPRPLVRAFGPGGVDKEIAELRKFEEFYRKVFAATAADNGQTDPRELARRGRPQLRAPDISGAGAAAPRAQRQISEAERYLESLEREKNKLDELTTVQQLLRDIEQGRVEGITPKLREKLFLEAASVDVMKSQTKQLRDQQQALDDLVASSTRRADELDRILSATPTGRAQDIERRVDIVLRYAQANPEDEAIQRQALEATKQLRKEFDALAEPPKEVVKEVDKMQLSIDRFAEKSIDALVEFAATGKGSFSSLFDSFKRDVLRELIEDPVRESMKNVVKIITDELGKTGQGEGLLGGLFKALSSGGGAGGQGGGFADLFARLFASGSTGRANGGSVKAGDLVRWQENGREWFVPQQNGMVINQAQMRAFSGAGMQQVNHFNINGGDTATLRAELRAALDEREARLMRSLRNGRASAYVGA